MANNIAIILYDFTIAGGVQRTTMYFAKVLAECEFNVDIITFFTKDDVFDLLHETIGGLPSNIRLLKLEVPRTSVTLVSILSRIMQHKLKNYNIVVNMHGDVQPVKGELVYFHQFNVDYSFFTGNMLQKAKLVPLWQMRRKFIEELKRDNTLIAVNSAWTKAEAIRFWNLKNVYVLYPPIPIEKLRRYAGRPRSKDYVVTVSRFSPDRGIENVLKLARQIPYAKFIIAGYIQNAKYFTHLLMEKPNNVLLCPTISEDYKMKLLREAKVYLNPTPWVEGFGIAVAEGMAAGLIPVTKNIGGVVDFVPEKYRFNDLSEARKIVKEALKNWSVEASLHISNLVNRFSIDKFRSRVLELINCAK